MYSEFFGGGGIIGFSPNSPKESILVYKKKKHYNEWEFVYDPLADQMVVGGGNAGTIGAPVGAQPGAPGVPAPSPTPISTPYATVQSSAIKLWLGLSASKHTKSPSPPRGRAFLQHQNPRAFLLTV